MWPGKWKRWRYLHTEQKVIWLKAALCLILIKTGLTLLPFDWFRRLFQWLTETGAKKGNMSESVEISCWAVKSAAHHLPLTLLCLPQALSAKYLLRKDVDIKVHIGVLMNTSSDLEAHAWVEWRGKVVLGELPDKHFQPIWVWQ